MNTNATHKVMTFLATLLLLGLFCSSASGELGIRRENLGGYNVDISQSSVSGLSAGAFMADQFFVVFSDDLVGVGIFAGGPYNCSRATLTTALQDCMANPDRLNQNVIDQLDHIVSSGTKSRFIAPHGLVRQSQRLFRLVGVS